jgi:hypothetical protein
MNRLRAAQFLEIAVLCMALFCGVGLWRSIAVVGLHVPLDPNEGWNAYHAVAAMSRLPLYPGPESYLVNNYPPLSFYIVGALGKSIGDYIVAGRIISLLSLGVVAFGIFAASMRINCERAEAMFAALCFVGGMLTFTDYVGMDDPQMLAHAVAIVGLLILLREPRSMSRVCAASLLFVLAVFIKHNVIVLGTAMFVWLAVYDRRSAVRLAAFASMFLLIGLVLFRFVYGTSLFSQLNSPRTYALEDLWNGLLNWLYWGLIPLTGLAALAWSHWNDKYVRLCVFASAIGIGFGALFLGGAGVDANVLFDADIALSLGIALFLNRHSGGWRSAVAAGAFVAPLILAGGLSPGDDEQNLSSLLHPMRSEAQLAQRDIAFLQDRKGPVLCEMLSICYWAGKPASVDAFNVGEEFETGDRSDIPLSSMIATRHFAVIQFDPDSPYSLGENVHNAVAKAYRLDHTDDYGAFYVPR